MSVSALLFVLFADLKDDPTRMGYIQLLLGLILAAVLPVSRFWPETKNQMLASQGILLCMLVPIYCVFMWYTMNSVVANASINHKNFRFSHAPGVLAAAFAYGLRMIYDFGFIKDRSRSFASKLGVVGLFIGGTCDLFVLYFMVTSFSKW